MAGQRPLSEAIAKRLMIFLGRSAHRPNHDPVRCCVFQQGSLELRRPSGPRKRGRPRQIWGNMVMANCVKVFGSRANIAEYFRPKGGAAQAWKLAVSKWSMT